MTQRIVVTGLGAVSALGLSVSDTWAAARDGKLGIAPMLMDGGPNGPEPHTTSVAMVVDGALAATEEAVGRRIGSSLDAFGLYAVKASHEALNQAGLLGALGSHTAAVYGHGFAGLHTLEEGFERFYGRKAARLHPLTVPKVMVSAPVSAIAMEFGIKGPVFGVTSACSSSGHAIIQGAALLASGMADVAVVGGSEAINTPGCLRAWEGLQAMSPSTCRPFSEGRDGMAIGEGAATFVLETLEHAQRRGATILAELTGSGMSSDAFHWTQPSLDGALAAMRPAIEQAGVLNDEQLLISAHGTGTPLNDKNESLAIRTVFGERAKNHPVIATKSQHGHLIGATLALQGVIALEGLRHGLAPAIQNYLGPDPDCDLNLVLGEPRPITATSVVLNAFAFGGLNTTLVLKLWG
jgi:nodulation protein E